MLTLTATNILDKYVSRAHKLYISNYFFIKHNIIIIIIIIITITTTQ